MTTCEIRHTLNFGVRTLPLPPSLLRSPRNKSRRVPKIDKEHMDGHHLSCDLPDVSVQKCLFRESKFCKRREGLSACRRRNGNIPLPKYQHSAELTANAGCTHNRSKVREECSLIHRRTRDACGCSYHGIWPVM